MKKNVLVITGSPRKGGNSDLLANAFAKGAKEAGHDVTIFDAASDPVQPCQACDACWSAGAACVADDGFARLAPLMECADAIVFCGPVYWYSFSSQIKLVIDKLYAFAQTPEKLEANMYLMMVAGDPSPEIFSIVTQEFDSSVKFFGREAAGHLLIPGVYAKDDIRNSDALARAEAFGRNVA
ncbi:flavodoxin family protein [Desulfovibrio sp. OttesenSCG-928-I05]|nr:flavodoxin family protein [Desulfovibrio sp. OttesenSCG-928-I05]